MKLEQLPPGADPQLPPDDQQAVRPLHCQDPEEEVEEGFEGNAGVTMGTSACSRVTLESKAGIATGRPFQ